MANCEEKSGFLFSHACSEIGRDRCGVCNKNICQAHSHPTAGTIQCTTCVKKEQKTTRAPRQRDRHRHDVDDGWHRSPYFYGYHYYHGYGYYHHGYWGHDHLHDPNDFTPGDTQSLGGETGEGFEQDLGGS